MTDIDRRTLLAGTAAAATVGAVLTGTAAKAMQYAPNLAGKSILITGCSSGFGRIGAVHYAQRGAKVFATMRNLPRPEADELRAQAEKEQLDIHIIEIDVTSDEQVTAGVAEAERINGGALDVLINNAGMSTAGPIEIQDMEATQLMFETNVFGPQRMMRAALPAMRAAKSGQIFNVTSQLGRVMLPGFGQYSPTKFALEAMSEQIAYELVQHNIDVTIIEPGGYPTKIWENANAMTQKLLDRADPVHLDGYAAMIEQLRANSNDGGETDPADVPRAIAEIIAMPAGTRPLRKEVHPGPKPQMAINKVCADVQVGWLGASPYGPWVKAVHHA
ncbi:MAG: SDR family oxidoreductase [Pontixanthobacter sp.]